jgi:hypothetical protein
VVRKQFFDSESNVARDLSKQRRSDVSAFVHVVHGNSRPATIGMSVLNVRPALPDRFESEAFKKAAHFVGF